MRRTRTQRITASGSTLRSAAVCAAVLAACAACSGTPPGNTQSAGDRAPTTAAREQPPAALPLPTPEPAGTPPASRSAEGAPQAPDPATLSNPQWRPGDESAAQDTAEKALRDFARPQIPNPQWANDLARWLTPAATADYAGVDPANVPASAVTGKAAVQIDPANGFGATATVPTDIGTYTVQLLRRDQGSPWKVNRLHPPTDTTPAPTPPDP